LVKASPPGVPTEHRRGAGAQLLTTVDRLGSGWTRPCTPAMHPDLPTGLFSGSSGPCPPAIHPSETRAARGVRLDAQAPPTPVSLTFRQPFAASVAMLKGPCDHGDLSVPKATGDRESQGRMDHPKEQLTTQRLTFGYGRAGCPHRSSSGGWRSAPSRRRSRGQPWVRMLCGRRQPWVRILCGRRMPDWVEVRSFDKRALEAAGLGGPAMARRSAPATQSRER